MATWRDGAEYAPTERPQGFATPTVAPFPEHVPWQAATPGPVAAPAEFEAPRAAPLAPLTAGESPRRDPRDAFTVSTMALAPGTAPGAARDPRQPIVTSATGTTLGPEWDSREGTQLPPPTGAPLFPAPLPPVPRPPAPYAGPLPSSTRQLPAAPTDRAGQEWRTRRKRAEIAAAVSFLGVLVPIVAPFVLVGAGVLGLRTKPLTGRAGPWALGIGLATLGVGLVTDRLDEPSPVAAVAALVFTIVFLRGGLRQR